MSSDADSRAIEPPKKAYACVTLSFVFLLLFLDTGCVHLISLMWLEDVIASSSSVKVCYQAASHPDVILNS